MTRPSSWWRHGSQPAVEPMAAHTTPNVLWCQYLPGPPGANRRVTFDVDRRCAAGSDAGGSRRLGGVLLLIAVLLGTVPISRVGGVRATGSASRRLVPRRRGLRIVCMGDRVAGHRVAERLSTIALVGSQCGRFVGVPFRLSDQHQGELVAFRLTPQRNGGVVPGDSDAQWCGGIANRYRLRAISAFSAPAGGLSARNEQCFGEIFGASPHSWRLRSALSRLGAVFGLVGGAPPAGRPRPIRSVPIRWRPRSAGVLHLATSRPRIRVAPSRPYSTPGADADCTALVHAMTGLPDVNAGGVLASRWSAADVGRRREARSVPFERVGSNRLIRTLIVSEPAPCRWPEHVNVNGPFGLSCASAARLGRVRAPVAVILAVAVSPAFGRAIHQRHGVRRPFPPPPAVGDCLLSAVTRTDWSSNLLLAARVGFRRRVLGRCGRARARKFRRDRFGDRRSTILPGVAADGHPSRTPGAVAGGRRLPRLAGPTWAPVTPRKVFLLGPDISDCQSGQRWLACAIARPTTPISARSGRGDSFRCQRLCQCRSLSAPGPSSSLRPAPRDRDLRHRTRRRCRRQRQTRAPDHVPAC